MAIKHIQYNHGSQHGAVLHGNLLQFENSFEGLNRLLATMEFMIDGDGSDPSHFAYLQGKFGFTDNATAKEGYETIKTALEKLNAAGSLDAILKACNKLR